MKAAKQSPLFAVARKSDPPVLVHDGGDLGSVWAVYVESRPSWVVRIPMLSYTFLVDPDEPERFVVHIVEEAAHRLRHVVDLKIDPARVKGLSVPAGTSAGDVQAAVDHLDRWYRTGDYWKHDAAWQAWLAR
jgi:hypothetical protein